MPLLYIKPQFPIKRPMAFLLIQFSDSHIFSGVFSSLPHVNGSSIVGQQHPYCWSKSYVNQNIDPAYPAYNLLPASLPLCSSYLVFQDTV